jgi:hypothetical protein
MTMKNVEGTDDAREVLGTLADNVRARAEVASDLLRGLVIEATDVNIGARAALRAIDDEVEVLTEEAQQLAQVVRHEPPAAPPPAAAPAPPVVVQPQAVPVVIAPAADPPTVVGGAPTPEPNEPGFWHLRSWSILQWIMAIVGALIGLLVASQTNGFEHFHGLGRGFFAAAWFIVLIIAGFGIGGVVGFLLDLLVARLPHRPPARQRRTVSQQQP